MINTSQGKGGSGGRIEALEELNRDRIPLVGVNAAGAFLQGVRLRNGKLLRCNFEACDLRNSDLSAADMQYADLKSANFRDANLSDANLENADLRDTDLYHANLRNAKNLADTVKALRPTESEPLLVINKTGLPKRPEIAAQEFATSIECRLLGTIPFDAATFGTAANNGQMLSEVAANNKTNEIFRQIGMHVTGRSAPELPSRASSLKLPSFMKRKKA